MGTAYSARQSSYTQGDTINADDTNDEFDAILAALGTSGHSHDGTAGEGGAIAKLLSNTLTFGAATSGTDITITFDGESNDGVLAWMEDEDYFKFSDDILINSTEKIMFGDTASFIHQSSDGVLTIDGEATIDLNASTAVLVSNDLKLNSDAAVLGFGADNDVTLTHVADTGVLLNSTMAIQFNDASQYINAPSATVLDINATDEVEVNATLMDVNANLDVSGTYTGAGLMTTGGNIVIPNAGNIGSASDTDAIAISSGGVVTMNQIPVFSAGINVSGGTIAGTLATAAQGNVTSLGTLTTLTVDNIIINGTTIGHTSDTDAMTISSGGVVTFSQTPIFSGDLTIEDDLYLDSDSAVIHFGEDGDITLTHAADTGLTTNGTFQATTITATTAVVPDASDGAALGTTSLEWSDLYLADGAVVGFGDDQDVTLTHVADTGLLLSSTDQLQFGDSGTYIHQSADGVLDLVSDTEIEINATTIDINGAVDVSGAYTGGGLMTTGGNIVIPNAGNIGSASDTDAISISSGGVVTFSQTPVFSSDLTLGDDLYLDSDGAVIHFGDDGDVTLTHVADTGLLLNSTMALQFNDASQYINAPSATVLDINATDEIELNATLADVNANLDVSGTYTGGGLMTTGGNIVIPDAGNIGSASDTDAIAISSGGVVTMNQIPVFSAGINVSGGTIAGTLATAAQGNVTSLGTLTTLTVDNVIINGTTIGHTSDTDLLTLTSGVLTVAGELDAATLDISGNADIDGTTNLDAVDIDGAVQIDNTVTVGVDDTGYDVKFFGDTASAYMLWDTSTDDLILGGAATLAIGTTAPDANHKLEVSTGGTTEIALIGGTSSECIINMGDSGARYAGRVGYANSGDTMYFWTGQGERLELGATETVFNDISADTDFRVESNGNANMLFVDGGNDRVGIGTASPASVFTVYRNDTATGGQVLITQAGTGDPNIQFSTAATSHMIGIDNSDSDSFKIDYGTTGTGAQTGYTLDTSGNSSVKRLFVEGVTNNTGGLFIGGTTVRNVGQVSVDFDSTAAGGIGINDTNSGNGAPFAAFLTGGTFRAAITNNNNTAVAYNTTSDARLKENIRPIPNAVERLKTLKPVKFDWIETGFTSEGFIAQEVVDEQLAKDMVTGDPNGDVKENPMQIEYGRLTVLLTKALQESLEKIDMLETRIESLEGK